MAVFRSLLTLGLSAAAACVLALPLGACKPAGQETTAVPAEANPDSASPSSSGSAAMTVTRWRCGEIPVATHFDDASLESITLQTPDRTLTLKSMANEDGARFADAAGNEFWSRPGKVSLTQVGQPAVECRKERA